MAYIEREAVLKKIESCAMWANSFGALYETVQDMTPDDVAPVRHGRWNADETCPFCGKKSTEGLDADKWDYWFPDFCPHCGAKMDGGETDA